MTVTNEPSAIGPIRAISDTSPDGPGDEVSGTSNRITTLVWVTVASAENDPPKVNGGIFDGGLGTYRTVTDDDYAKLFISGLVVLDANALLNLYRYHPTTRKLLIDIFTRLKSRIWVPHQAMFEFFENRISVIDAHSSELQKTLDGLLKNETQLEEVVRTWANRAELPQSQLNDLLVILKSAADSVTTKISQLGVDDTFKDADDTAKDPVVTALKSILSEGVGPPLPPDELQAAKQEAYRRIETKAPPGWKDASKRSNAEGDYLAWHETLIEAKRVATDVLFVTGDVKEDWWRKQSGEAKGPLPELVYEMFAFAGVRLFMMRPATLLRHVGKTLKINVSEESVQDAERVSTREQSARLNEYRIYEQELHDTLTKFGYLVTDLTRSSDNSFDFVVKNDEHAVYVDAKFRHQPLLPHSVAAVAGFATASDLPVFLISNMQLTKRAESLLESFSSVNFVIWRDSSDDDSLREKLKDIFAHLSDD